MDRGLHHPDVKPRDQGVELPAPGGIGPSRFSPAEARAARHGDGRLKDELCARLGVPAVPVVSVATHDTASAVLAAPAEEEEFLFISCGTWSLFGTELAGPLINERARLYNLSNELGYGGKVIFLKNIIGLWLIQETRRQFRREGKEYSYADMERLARSCEPFACFIDPDAPEFVPPGDIPGRIRAFCERTGQRVPRSDGEIVRCIYESLALEYRYVFEQLKACAEKEYRRIYLARRRRQGPLPLPDDGRRYRRAGSRPDLWRRPPSAMRRRSWRRSAVLTARAKRGGREALLCAGGISA